MITVNIVDRLKIMTTLEAYNIAFIPKQIDSMEHFKLSDSVNNNEVSQPSTPLVINKVDTEYVVKHVIDGAEYDSIFDGRPDIRLNKESLKVLDAWALHRNDRMGGQHTQYNLANYWVVFVESDEQFHSDEKLNESIETSSESTTSDNINEFADLIPDAKIIAQRYYDNIAEIKRHLSQLQPLLEQMSPNNAISYTITDASEECQDKIASILENKHYQVELQPYANGATLTISIPRALLK